MGNNVEQSNAIVKTDFFSCIQFLLRHVFGGCVFFQLQKTFRVKWIVFIDTNFNLGFLSLPQSYEVRQVFFFQVGERETEVRKKPLIL